MEMRFVAEGLNFPAGPLVLPDGDVAMSEVCGGAIVRIGSNGARSIMARTGGGPIGAANPGE